MKTVTSSDSSNSKEPLHPEVAELLRGFHPLRRASFLRLNSPQEQLDKALLIKKYQPNEPVHVREWLAGYPKDILHEKLLEIVGWPESPQDPASQAMRRQAMERLGKEIWDRSIKAARRDWLKEHSQHKA